MLTASSGADFVFPPFALWGACVALTDGHDSVSRALAAGAPSRRALPPLPLAALEQLSRLHAEQVETAQRMMFLRGTVNAALGLMLLGIAALAVGAGTSLALCFTWSLLMLLAIGALLSCHVRASAADRLSLEDAVKDLRAILLYAGFAWGTGALLVLPPDAGPLLAVPFIVLPSAAMALLLRDAGSTLAFLVVATAIGIAAAILRPWPDAGLDTALLLLLQSGIAAQTVLRGNRVKKRAEKMPAGLALRS